MSPVPNTLTRLQLAQICWVIPDIHAATKLLSASLGIPNFPEPQQVRAQDLEMKYYGKVVPGEWLTTQAYNGKTFIELVQPISGQSMFHDYLEKYPLGGTQHMAFRLPVDEFQKVCTELSEQGYALISEVNHPIAKMAFFDTYSVLGVAIEIMGVTKDGWDAIKGMEGQ